MQIIIILLILSLSIATCAYATRIEGEGPGESYYNTVYLRKDVTNDPLENDLDITGDVFLSDFDSGNEGIAHVLNDTINCGVLHNIVITDETGINISWAAGVIWDCVSEATVEIDAHASIACSNDNINYLWWDRSGATTTLTLGTALPNYVDNDVLVGVITVQSNDIYEIHTVNVLAQRENDISTAISEILQVVVTTGLVVSEDIDVTNAFDVQISAGTFYHFGTTRHNLAAGFNTRTTAMTRWFHTGGTWVNDTDAEIDMDEGTAGINRYDNLTNRVDGTAAKYYKSLFMYSENMIHWIYPQAEYDTLAQAVAADLPVIPSVGEYFPRMVTVVMKGNDAAFPLAGGNRWDYSVKPTLGSIGLQSQDHASQINLVWTLANHSGTASNFAGFNGTGVATEYPEANYLLADGTRTGATSQAQVFTNGIRPANLTDNGFVKTSGGNGALSVDTEVYAPDDQTFYIGTTQVAINRASATLNLAGIGTLGAGATTVTSLDAGSGAIITTGTADLLGECQFGNATTISHGMNTAPTATKGFTGSFSNDVDGDSTYHGYYMTINSLGDVGTNQNKNFVGFGADVNTSGTNSGSGPLGYTYSYGYYILLDDTTHMNGAAAQNNMYGFYVDSTFSGTVTNCWGISNYGGYFKADGNLGTVGTTQHTGVFGSASQTADNNYGGYFVASQGTNNVGVWTTGTQYGLWVNGGDVRLGSGAVTSTGNITTTGTGTFGGTSAGQSTIDSGLVVNEAGGNAAADDFRAETANEGNALVVDASADQFLINVTTILTDPLTATTITGTSLTDGTTTITGGNYTGVGNITGTDVDISAGTGDIDTTGTMAAKGYTSNLVTKTGAYTLTVADDTVLGNTNAFTLTLPTASGITGKTYTIKKINTEYDEALTIDGSGAETIDGNATHLLYTVNSGIEIQSDGTNWVIIGSF